MQDAGCRMQDAGYRMQDTGCGIQDARYRMLDAGARFLGGPMAFRWNSVLHIDGDASG